jgi:hypothetical protein
MPASVAIVKSGPSSPAAQVSETSSPGQAVAGQLSAATYFIGQKCSDPQVCAKQMSQY